MNLYTCCVFNFPCYWNHYWSRRICINQQLIDQTLNCSNHFRYKNMYILFFWIYKENQTIEYNYHKFWSLVLWMDLLICNVIVVYIDYNTTMHFFQCASPKLWSKNSNQHVPALLVDRWMDDIPRLCKCYERFTRVRKSLLVYPLVCSASRLVHIYEYAHCLNKTRKSVAIRQIKPAIVSVALYCDMHNSQNLWKLQAYWTVQTKFSSNSA